MINSNINCDEYYYNLFMQSYYTNRLYNRMPYKVEVLLPDDKHKTFLMFRRSPKGYTSTKNMTVLNKDSDCFKDLLLDAYPDLLIIESDSSYPSTNTTE